MEGKSCNKKTDNEMDELKGKEEQEEQDRRLERKDGPNEMNAFKCKEEVNELDKQWGGSNERSRS